MRPRAARGASTSSVGSAAPGLDLRAGDPPGASVGRDDVDGAEIGQGGYDQLGEAFEALFHPERGVERLAHVRQQLEAPLGAYAVGDVGHEDAHAHHLALVAHRVPGEEQVVLDARIRGDVAADLDVLDRLLGIEHAPEHAEHLLGEGGNELGGAQADVVVLGQAVHLGQGLVDPHVAHLAIEEREAQRGARDDRVEQLPGAAQVVGGDARWLVRRGRSPAPRAACAAVWVERRPSARSYPGDAPVTRRPTP